MEEITTLANGKSLESFTIAPFNPPALLAGADAQTLYPRLGPNRLKVEWYKRQLRKTAQEIIIPTTGNARLHGYLNQTQKDAPLIIMIHGWLGSSESIYLLSTAQQLIKQGYSVFRLHLRDHGPTTHLNKTLFNAARIDEVFEAIRYLKANIDHQGLGLIGYSLGGNFALRIAANNQQEQLNIDSCIASCPVLDPLTASECFSKNAMYHDYFVKAWKDIFAEKQKMFRDFIDPAVFEMNTYDEITDYFVAEHTPYDSVANYYQQYTIDASLLNEISIPTVAFIADNDPILPTPDFIRQFKNTDYFTAHLNNSGGHCGFQDSWLSSSWIDQQILAIKQHIFG